MKLFKPMYVVAIAAITFTSCGSVKNMTVPAMETAVQATAKKGVINEEDFNHWAHADLVTDSIPGMSLDKAYQFIEGKKIINDFNQQYENHTKSHARLTEICNPNNYSSMNE